jgi:ribokinase
MSGREIVSIGGISIDVLMTLDDLPTPGRCMPVSALDREIGGKGANQAVAAARLGGRVALVGAAGADAAGADLLARLEGEGVSTQFVGRTGGTQTGMFIMQRDPAGRKQTAVFHGANDSVGRDVIDAAAALIGSARVVMVQLEIPLDAAGHAMQLARSGGAMVIFDPSPARPIPPEFLRTATVLKANAVEASMLTGIFVSDLPTARAAAARLLEMGAGLVAIEAGRSGNLFCSTSEEVFLPLYDVATVDPTGAGDTLVGALAVALVESLPLRAAAEFATAAAALATRRLGAQASMPHRDEVAALIGHNAAF